MSVRTTLPQLVECLGKLDVADVSIDRVTEILHETCPTDASLRPYVRFSDEKYTRNLVYRSDLFDVMVICWQPGQQTPVHNHNGNMGWIRVLRGRMDETFFQYPDGATTMDLDKVEIDDDGVGHNVELIRCEAARVAASDTILSVDAVRAIHQVANPAEHRDDDPAVTLHVYSRPHDTCLAFDLEERTCRRREMVFDSVPQGQAGA